MSLFKDDKRKSGVDFDHLDGLKNKKKTKETTQKYRRIVNIYSQ